MRSEGVISGGVRSEIGDTPLMKSLYFGVFVFFNVISLDYLSMFLGDTPQK